MPKQPDSPKSPAVHQLITPVMIVATERYAKMAAVSIGSFLKHHNYQIIVAGDEHAYEKLEKFSGNQNLKLVYLNDYIQRARQKVSCKIFVKITVDSDGEHDRTFSSLKPIVMADVASDHMPYANYILSLDADTLFTGNIIKITKEHLVKNQHKFDIYMVKRTDNRMQVTCDRLPGSGFTLWKKSSLFIELFIKHFNSSCGSQFGGSQALINYVKNMSSLKYYEIDDPFLHLISPDNKNPNLTKDQVLEFQPAYIHLHGPNAYSRLLTYDNIFSKQEEK